MQMKLNLNFINRIQISQGASTIALFVVYYRNIEEMQLGEVCLSTGLIGSFLSLG